MSEITGFNGVVMQTSTRNGGFSKEPYDTLNMAMHVGDDSANVLQNRELFFNRLGVGITAKNSIFTRQFHSIITLKVDFDDAGKGYDSFENGVVADALYTKEAGLNLAIYHADCVPLFISVPTHNLVGIIHAGAEGSLAGITTKFLETLIKDEGVKPLEVYACLGPALSFSHRLISREEALEIASRGEEYTKAVKATGDDYFLDLPLLNVLQLRKGGVPFTHISFSDECTYENSSTYFSAAKAKKATGRNISFIRRELK